MPLIFLLIPLTSLTFFLSLFNEGSHVLFSIPWVEQLGVYFSFSHSKLSLFMGLIISLIGTVITFYATQYMTNATNQYRFWTFFCTFMLSMLGLVLSENLLTLFLFWEATSICSFFLIGHYHEDEKARTSAMNSLLITGGGGIFLLLGFIGLSIAGGSYEISNLIENKEAIISNPYVGISFGLIMIGVMTKSAQFPFHFWLPMAMTGPAPVSSFLHSATMVKAGVFLLARLFPILSELAFWTPVVTSVGLVTFLWGGGVAIKHFDMKKILANTTISALGCLVALLGMAKVYPKAMEAFILFFLAHALYKAALFMCAGIIEKKYRIKDIREIRMSVKDDYFLSFAIIVSCLSMMGLPPTIGFIAKETFLEFSMANFYYLVPLMIGGLLNFVAAGKILYYLFCAPKDLTPIKYEKSTTSLSSAPFSLSILTLVLSFLGLNGLNKFVNEFIFERSQIHSDVNITIWHGFNLPLLLSLITVLCGVLFIFYLIKYKTQISVNKFVSFSPTQIYKTLFASLLTNAAIFSRFYQSGYLRRYFLVIFSTASMMILFGFLYFKPELNVANSPIPFMDACIGLIIVFSTISTLATDSKIWAVTQLGLVGSCLILFFIFYGAPDLALTQLLVEIFTLVIFVFALHRLPRLKRYSSHNSRARDLALSGIFGLLMGYLTYFSFSTQLDKSVANFYAQKAYIEAHGKNIVNVILVDFRAFDTLGEISVMLMAALGVYILMRKRGESNE